MRYSEAENKSWTDIQIAGLPSGKLPLPMHIPLGKPFEANQIVCDGALTAWKLAVPPDMSIRDIESWNLRNSLKTTLVSVAFGRVPAVPEFRQITWKREPGGYPIVTGSIDICNIIYSLTYCVDPESGELYIHGCAKNTGYNTYLATLRFRRSNPVESTVTDYHYATFRWDAERWQVGEPLPPPELVESELSAEVEKSWKYSDEEYNLEFCCERPYYVHPSMRLPEGGNVLKLSAEIPSGESRSFTIRAGFAEGATISDFAAVVKRSKAYWDSLLTAKADFGDPEENDIFRQFQWGNLQYLMNTWNDASADMLQPSQGGWNERFYVWVWEAMDMLRPLLRLGHFEPVRQVLEYILRLQDSGYMPEGDFTTLSGAIGTTGPRWANSTGSALILASEYLTLSGDRAFRDKHLANLIRAAKWILGEIKATRKLNPDGTRCLGYGLMPVATATDGDKGLVYVMTDTWSCIGVESLLNFLKAENHPEYEEMAAECRQYRQDISAAIDSVRQPDGFIDRKLGDNTNIARSFSACCSAIFLMASGYSPNHDERMEDFVRYSEENIFDGLFCGPMLDSVKYMGNIERVMTRFYMAHKRWKSAYLAWKTFRNYGMSTPLCLTQERYSQTDEAFTPWQPNSSGNGRYLDIQLERICYHTNDELILLGGYAPFQNHEVALEHIHTAYGLFSFKVSQNRLTAAWEHPLPSGTKVSVPDYLGFRPDEMLETCPDGRFRLKTDSNVISGLLTA